MTWLLPEQLAAVAELQAVCARQGADTVIIGAAAYRTWFHDPGRHTEDVDVAVAVDLEEFAQLTEALATLGRRQEQRREHRWRTPAGARVDLLPAGPAARAAGRIEWPRSGMVMNLAGFEHVFAQAVTKEVALGTTLRVCSIPVLALLKIASFLDSPHSRMKDAQDLLAILGRYEMDGDRRFGAEVYDAGVDYDHAGAFLLGQDPAALCNEDEAGLASRFVRAVLDDSTPASLVFAQATGSPALVESGEGRRKIIAGFAAGFSQVRERSRGR